MFFGFAYHLRDTTSFAMFLLNTTPFPVNGSFGFVVPMILVVDFMGNAINFFQKSLASVLVPFCMDDRFTREFSECSQKSLFSSGLTYFW